MNNFLKIILRNYRNKPIYSFITFTGFTIGVAASLLIYIWVHNELSYEKFHPDYSRIYRVLTLTKDGNEMVKSAGCYRPVAKTLKMAYPQIECATYLSYSSEDSPLKKQSGGEKIEARYISTNEDFFSIFGGFKFIEGTPKNALSNPSSIVLSEEVAKKLFGNESALGKTIISDKYEEEIYIVSAVVSIPKQSHIDFGYIISEKNSKIAYLADSWGDKSWVHVYIKIAKNAKIDDQFINGITNHLNKYKNSSDKLIFQPLTDIHLHSDYQDFVDINVSSYKYVLIFSGLAFIIILMAALNFSVLSVARSSERATEIGIKKVSGAGRLHIIGQFMGEAIIQTITAAMVAIFIIWLILPWFNSIIGQSIAFHLSFDLFLNLFLLTVIVGVIAGLYPSFYLSALKPIGIFRGGSITGSKSGFTNMLVVIQFSIAIFFMIATFIFVKQLDYIHNKDLGFDKKNVVVIPTGLWYECKEFKDELLRNPKILSVSASSYSPIDYSWQQTFAINHKNRIDSIRSTLICVDENFAKTYKLSLLKGQFIQMNYDSYWKELKKAGSSKNYLEDATISIPVVINETAEKLMKFDNPIGERIGSFVIAGVVKDFNFRPLKYLIGPLIMVNDPQNIMTMNVRIAPGNTSETIKFIDDTYKKYRNGRDFSYNFFDDLLAREYQDEMRLRNLTMIFSILAIIISMLGILGMTVFSCDRRTKEIGIRKANGASINEIMIMLNKDFVKWVIVAFVIACPIAWYTMYQWLQNFAYRTELSWWIFILVGCFALILAFITINWQTWKIAKSNPVDAIRSE